MQFSKTAFIVLLKSFLIIFAIISSAHGVITVSGPIAASSVTTNGDVTFSSMTVSTITINNLVGIPSITSGVPGRVVQMLISSTTATTSTTAQSFVAVSGMSKSITLSNANNYVRISITGTLYTAYHSPDGEDPASATVFRDSTNLGDLTNGLATIFTFLTSSPANLAYTSTTPVGIRIVDFPGDTNTHIYQVYIKATFGTQTSFPANGVAYMLLEEISQ